MSESRWMKVKNSKIRIGPEFQAVLPDPIQIRSERVPENQTDSLMTVLKLSKSCQSKNVCLIKGDTSESSLNKNTDKKKTKTKDGSKESQSSSIGGTPKDTKSVKVIKTKKK